ncbi:MAG: glycosyltransferase family 39 protein [Candidatus Eremiobacteraeota bacterium]|nr:glycosyltransferase family 39 protein [Candidatus Eremiobacteraeota bacterium]
MSQPTTSTSFRHDARTYGWLGAAVLVGAVCRFWDLTGPSLFIDEGFVFHISEHAPREILQLVAYGDFHPPLFYLISHFLMSHLHWPLWDYRYFTSAFSLLGIAATWAIARRCFGDTAAAVAAFALALEPALIEFDRLYRMYAILTALGAVSWWLLLRASTAQGKAWPWWIAYGLAAVTLPYVHYVGALVVASQGLYALTGLRRMWPALACGLVAALALVPWLWAIKVQYPNGGLVIRLDSPEFSWPHVIRSTIAYGLPIDWMIKPAFDLTFSVVVGILGLAGIYLGRKTLLPFWFLPVVVQVVASFATGKDLVIPRYLYVDVPAFCIGFGALVAALAQTRFRVLGAALVATYIGLSIMSVYDLIFVPFYQFPNWYEINALLLPREHKTDIIVMDQGAEYWVVRDFSAFRGHQMQGPALPSDLAPTIRWLDGYGKRRVWYIENQPGFTDAGHRVERALDATRPVIGRWHQPRAFREDIVRVVLYGPRFPSGGKKSVVKTTSP